MKTYAAGAACLLAACLAAACGDDDDDGGGAAGGMPPVADAGIKFPVTAIYWGNYPEPPEASFSYENGRMTSFIDDDERYIISENPLTVKQFEGDDIYEEYKNIRVNGMGFITSYDFDGRDGYDVWSGNFTAEYDGDGHEVRETYREQVSEEDEVFGYTITTEFTWKDGNIIKVSQKEKDEESGGYDLMEWEITYDEEGRYPNPGVWSFFSDYSYSWEEGLIGFYYGGLMGKPTKDIPVKCVFTETLEAHDSHPDTYTIADVEVDYNDDGSVDRISYHVGSGNYNYNSVVRFAYGNASGISYKSAADYSPVKENVTDGSRRGRRGLHKRLMERIAQRKNAR